MGKKRRLLGGFIGAFALVSATLATSITAGASSARQTYTITVDNAYQPDQHNFEYVDYFPRGQVLPTDPQAVIGNGSILHFTFGGAPDGLHTATFVPPGAAPPGFFGFDGDNGEGHPILNLAAALPTPGCGTAGTPCTYDGTAVVNSGAMPAFAPPDFYVKISLPTSTPTTLHYHCMIHPNMQGSILVVPGVGSSPSAFASNAASQFAADTAGALSAEVSASAAAQAGGFVVAGTATPFVEVAEMLPQTFTVPHGSQLTWNTLSLQDPHTVTFPQGAGSDGVDPLTPPWAPAECEGVPDSAGDTAIAGPPPGFGCPPGSLPELGVNPAPNGVTMILDQSTVATSGVISSPFIGFPGSAQFSFPNPGTYHYQCRIHDHMVGTIIVTP
jgi:plastocyanin